MDANQRFAELAVKACSACGEYKPITEFWHDKRNKDGYMNACKACRRSYHHKWVNENPSKMTVHRLKQRAKKIHTRAHRSVRKALLSQKLNKPNCCERCKAQTTDLHAHHDNYQNRLDVQWLCRICHHAIHLTPGLLRDKAVEWMEGQNEQ